MLVISTYLFFAVAVTYYSYLFLHFNNFIISLLYYCYALYYYVVQFLFTSLFLSIFHTFFCFLLLKENFYFCPVHLIDETSSLILARSFHFKDSHFVLVSSRFHGPFWQLHGYNGEGTGVPSEAWLDRYLVRGAYWGSTIHTGGRHCTIVWARWLWWERRVLHESRRRRGEFAIGLS